MPVRIQGRLLAELGTLLGLCLAAAGCQTSVARNDGAPPSLFGSNAQSPLLAYLRGERSSDGTSATQGQVVSMLRPVAVETDNSRVPAVSGWSPIQRTSGEVVAGASPGILNVDAQLQPNLEQPGQLGQPTQLVPQTVVEPPLVEGAHGMPMHALGMYALRELDKQLVPRLYPYRSRRTLSRFSRPRGCSTSPSNCWCRSAWTARSTSAPTVRCTSPA